MVARVASSAVGDKLAVAAAEPRSSLWRETSRRFRRHRLAMVGTVILLAMVIAVLGGPLVWRLPINEIDFKAKLKTPTWSHPLGTDDLGQDLLARMLYGGRISLAVGIAAMLIAISIGTAIGASSGYLGGGVDHALMRITDMFLSLPGLPLLLLIVYLFRDTLRKTLGPEVGVFILIVAVIGGLRWMPVARLVRAQFLSLREKEFVESARSLGAAPLRQVVRHILPNSMAPLVASSPRSTDPGARRAWPAPSMSPRRSSPSPRCPSSDSGSLRTSRHGAGSCSTRKTTSTSRPTGPSFRGRRSS